MLTRDYVFIVRVSILDRNSLPHRYQNTTALSWNVSNRISCLRLNLLKRKKNCWKYLHNESGVRMENEECFTLYEFVIFINDYFKIDSSNAKQRIQFETDKELPRKE